MELGISPINYNRNTRKNINFGMSVKFDNLAYGAIKRQALALGDKEGLEFINKLENFSKDLKDKPTLVEIHGMEENGYSNSLAATIIDTSNERLGISSIRKITYNQPIFFSKGKLKFLEKVKAKVEEIENLNKRMFEFKKNTEQITPKK